MISLRNSATLFFFFLLVYACHQKNDNTQFDTTEARHYIDQVYSAYPLPGLAVVLVNGDQSVAYTLGYCDLGDSIPFRKSTSFFGGSLSELLVAEATLQMQSQGKLMMADRVVDRLPYFEMQGDYEQVTIHSLLTHTSGIPAFNPAWDMPTYEDEALQGTTRSIIYQQLEFDPGSKVKRAPYNFDIAADLLQYVEGESFEKVMSKHLEGLGMMGSTYDFQGIMDQEIARPHQLAHWLTYDQKESEVYPYTRENAGSFGFHTSAEDMEHWIKMQLANPHPELFKKHYQTSKNQYKGYGWEVVQTNEDLVYNNHWSIGGFSGDLSLIPEKQLGVFVFANTAEDFNPTLVSRQLIDFLKGKELQQVKPPVHIAMSRQLAEGHCMEEVLAWCDNQINATEPAYEINPSLIGQFGVNLLHRLDMPDEAMRVFEYAVARYPNSHQAFLNLSEGYLLTGRVDKAKEAFDQAMEMKAPVTSYVTFLQEQITLEMENQNNT